MQNSLLARFSIYRPVTVGMLFLLAVVLGTISFRKIPLQLLPSGFSRPSLSVHVFYPGGAPEEIIRKIAEPMEGMMATLPGIKSIRSFAQRSQARIEITFQEGMDMRLAYREVQDRIERVRPQLPEDLKAQNIFVFKRSTDDIPVAAMAISYPEELQGLDQIIEVHLKSKLNRIEGVANVEVFGINDYAVFVDLNYHKVKSSGVGVYQLIEKLRTSSVALPSGAAQEGSKKLYIRTLSKFESLKEIEQLPITPYLPLGEIAKIQMGMPAPPFLATLEGKPAILCIVFKESDGNTVDVCQKIQEFLNNHPIPHLKTFLIFSQGSFIENSVRDLQYTALWGGLFAMVILLVFLRKITLTLLVTLAVPTSLVITLICMFFMGQSLNIISLMGIMLAVGMLVDNSVVVVESIAREAEEGFSAQEASLRGTSMVSLAITIATLTTTVVFLPFFLIDSAFRFWLKEMGLPICISLIASLFVALVFIPLVSSKILRTGAQKSQKESLLIRVYIYLLEKVLRRRFESVILIFLLMASIAFPYSRLPQTDQVQGHTGSVQLTLKFPGSKSLGETARRLSQFESLMSKHKEELGIELIRTFFSVQRGHMTLHLPTDKRPKLSPPEFYRQLKESLPRIPGVQANISQGGQSDSSSPQVNLRIVGKDPEILYELALKIKERLLSLKGVLDIELDVEKDSDEIHALLRKDLTEKFRISPQMVAQTIRYSLNGAPLPPAVIGNREVDVQMGLREEDRENLSLLKRVEVKSFLGRDVSLGALVKFEKTKALEKIIRVDKKTQITLTLTIHADSLMGFYNKMFERLKDFPLPEGYSFVRGSRFEEFQEMKQTGLFALSLDILFVFLLMGVLFESFLLPLCVMVSIPFAFLGVFWILYFTNTPLETMSIIGMVLLVGVVVNNAIVLIDRIGQLQSGAPSLREAILQAGRERLRPILMTALTTIFGLIPMALGNSNIVGRPYYPLGRAVIGGLMASTLLTLFVVPLLYTLLMDLQKLIKGLLGLK